MTTVYKNDLVDLKIVKVENNSNVFFQVWKDGIICKQSDSFEHCSSYAFDLIGDMVKEKLTNLESDVYWCGQAYLNCTDEFSYACAKYYTEVQNALRQFKELLK